MGLSTEYMTIVLHTVVLSCSVKILLSKDSLLPQQETGLVPQHRHAEQEGPESPAEETEVLWLEQGSFQDILRYCSGLSSVLCSVLCWGRWKQHRQE